MKRIFTMSNISVYADEHLDVSLSDVENTGFTVAAGDSHKLRLEYNDINTKWYLYDDAPDSSAGQWLGTCGCMDIAITVCLGHLYVAMYRNKVYFSKDVCKLLLMAWELEKKSQEQEEVPEEVPYP